MIKQSYETDEWKVLITWGKDVTGDDDDQDETLVDVQCQNKLASQDAVQMAQYIVEQLVGGE